jgi:hypothetical protein
VKEGILAARPFKITPRGEVAEPEKTAAAVAVADAPAEAPATESAADVAVEEPGPAAADDAVAQAEPDASE